MTRLQHFLLWWMIMSLILGTVVDRNRATPSVALPAVVAWWLLVGLALWWASRDDEGTRR